MTMEQTAAHEQYNPDLLAIIPRHAKRIVEVGCSSGALAREYKVRNNNCHYTGIEIVPEYAKLASRYCDSVLSCDIETADDKVFQDNSDCWVFGDSLEHLKDPWAVLGRIRAAIPSTGCIVACLPNAQHWSVQVLLSCGQFRYQDSGLLDRTHLRWFTRITMLEMFEKTGFKVIEGHPRIFNEPDRDKVLPAIRALASSIGANPEVAASDATAFQFVVRAVPK
jgi:2-polyprenyl-3-methyl-5-hydroxy-6-metoxy-1,4-benzoquinol methylase